MAKKNPLAFLVSPLDWGLGHTTRLVPLVHMLLKEQCRIILAGDGLSLTLLRQEFPLLESVVLPSIRVRYPKKIPLVLYIPFFLPFFLAGMVREHAALRSFLRKYPVNGVISDNRYGLWNRKVYNILITHQLMLKMPRGLGWLEYPVHRLIRTLISPFNECWVPDVPSEPSLSGLLSHAYPVGTHVSFIGPLSRFPVFKELVTESFQYDILALLSGPEPQRSVLEKKLLHHPALEGKKVFLVRGVPGEKVLFHPPDWKIAGLLTGDELLVAIRQSEYVICRSGYSGIMDLVRLKKKALLIPTPGQTEQEYLARHVSDLGLFPTTTQRILALDKLFDYKEPAMLFHYLMNDDRLLEDKIKTLTGKVISPEKEQSSHHNQQP